MLLEKGVWCLVIKGGVIYFDIVVLGKKTRNLECGEIIKENILLNEKEFFREPFSHDKEKPPTNIC